MCVVCVRERKRKINWKGTLGRKRLRGRERECICVRKKKIEKWGSKSVCVCIWKKEQRNSERVCMCVRDKMRKPRKRGEYVWERERNQSEEVWEIEKDLYN